MTRTYKLFTRFFSTSYRYCPPNPRNPSSILKAGQARGYPLGRSLGPPARPGTTMSTLRQIDANRRNAQKPTGPTSVTGKAVPFMNSLKSGIHGKSLPLPYENRADLEQLIDEYYQSFHPTSPEARSFVGHLIRREWTPRRLANAETQTWQYRNNDRFCDPEKYPLGKSATLTPNSFSKLQYRPDATRRARDRAIVALQKLQAKAAAAPTPAPVVEPAGAPSLTTSPQTTSRQIGFVPSTPATTRFPLRPPAPVPTPRGPSYRVRSDSSTWRALLQFPTSMSRAPAPRCMTVDLHVALYWERCSTMIVR
jgi:hypothetical protein